MPPAPPIPPVGGVHVPELTLTAPALYAPMSGVPERVPGLKHFATPPMRWMFSISIEYCHQLPRAMLPTSTGVRLTMHFGSNPTSFVGTPLPVVPRPMSVDAEDASVKSGLFPVGAVKYETVPVASMLFDQPEVGFPKTGFWPGPVPVATKTLFRIETPFRDSASVK